MLKQMLAEDKAESVRQAVVKSLGVIVAFIDDEDKFKQCWELMLRALNDPSQLVVMSVYSVLLPALAAWSFELGSLESELISYFLHQLLTCIKVHLSLSLSLSLSLLSLFFFPLSASFSYGWGEQGSGAITAPYPHPHSPGPLALRHHTAVR